MRDIQKKVYHKNRFYIHQKVPRNEVAGSRFQCIADSIGESVAILESYIELENLVIIVNKNEIVKALSAAKSSGFEMLNDMSAIHLSDDSFEVFYQLLSMEKLLRMRIKTHTKDRLDSISEIYRNAIWAERETFDMFGIKFDNHPNLKRILMPDDWSGHPLRKDYPLQGDEHAQWYEIDKIFGEEYREIVGAEQRDSSFIDPKDTFNFAHMGFEVPRGAPPSDTPKDIVYQESGGVFVVTKFDKQKQLEKRR